WMLSKPQTCQRRGDHSLGPAPLGLLLAKITCITALMRRSVEMLERRTAAQSLRLRLDVAQGGKDVLAQRERLVALGMNDGADEVDPQVAGLFQQENDEHRDRRQRQACQHALAQGNAARVGERGDSATLLMARTPMIA